MRAGSGTRMRRFLKLLAALAALVGGVWFFRRRRQSESWQQDYEAGGASAPGVASTPPVAPDAAGEFDRPPPTAPASEADPGTREGESRLDTETKYERELQSEIAERQSAAERLKDDPLNAQLSGDEPPRDTTT